MTNVLSRFSIVGAIDLMELLGAIDPIELLGAIDLIELFGIWLWSRFSIVGRILAWPWPLFIMVAGIDGSLLLGA